MKESKWMWVSEVICCLFLQDLRASLWPHLTLTSSLEAPSPNTASLVAFNIRIFGKHIQPITNALRIPPHPLLVLMISAENSTVILILVPLCAVLFLKKILASFRILSLSLNFCIQYSYSLNMICLAVDFVWNLVCFLFIFLFQYCFVTSELLGSIILYLSLILKSSQPLEHQVFLLLHCLFFFPFWHYKHPLVLQLLPLPHTC